MSVSLIVKGGQLIVLSMEHTNSFPLTYFGEKPTPSVIKAPKVELKPLPSHLKYVYLGENETLPVIISSALSSDQESRLVEVL